jgi:hypothetical protein
MTRLRPHRVALSLVLAFSALLECYRLAQNSWANDYYSAAVKSMLGSLHNFFFVASDPGGLISVDKPPIGLWLQTVSAAIFGFHPLSLLLPEALCAVGAVAGLYFIVAPRFGAWPGVAAAATLAVFPSFVASGRDNNLDALLFLQMVLDRDGELALAGYHGGDSRPRLQHQDARCVPRCARSGAGVAGLRAWLAAPSRRAAGCRHGGPGARIDRLAGGGGRDSGVGATLRWWHGR